MRIFLTGGTGFIGKPVTSLLADRGHELMVLSRSQGKIGEFNSAGLNVLEGNLKELRRLEGIIKKFRPHALVHLAWEGLPDYSLEMSRKNLDYAIDLFSLVQRIGCQRVLSTGSCWEYSGQKGMISEDDPVGRGSIFSAVKNACRCIGEALARDNGFRFYWLRLFFVYGPGQRSTSLIPHMIASIKDGKAPQVRTPHNKHDFVFVTDVARAIADVLERQPESTVYNIGSGRSTAVEDVMHLTYSLLGRSIPKKNKTLKNTGDLKDFWANISRIERDAGWQPTYTLRDGIQTTISSV